MILSITAIKWMKKCGVIDERIEVSPAFVFWNVTNYGHNQPFHELKSQVA